jgi:septum formation protein
MKLILASTSPRRIDLMKQVGLAVQVRKPEIDETPIRGESPRALVRRLSYQKAASIAERLRAGSFLVIAADTIVVEPTGKKILGKPSDKREAARMLASLAGREHTVLTGYCIFPRTPGKLMPALTRVVVSRVSMRKLSKAQIENYIRSGEPMDKAGSYAAQGLGMGLIESISGSYTNVVGLPMCQLLMDLESEFGVRCRNL